LSLSERMNEAAIAEAAEQEPLDSLPPDEPEDGDPVEQVDPVVEDESPEPMILGKFKDQSALEKAYQEAERSLRVAQEAQASSAETVRFVTDHEREFAEYLAAKQGAAKPPVTLTAPPPTDDVPAYDPAWAEMQPDEMSPQDKAGIAKYNRWFITRTRDIAHNAKLQDFLRDPSAFVQGVVEPVVGQLRRATAATAQERAAERQQNDAIVVLQPHVKDLFASGEVDWGNTTELGTKVLDIYNSRPAFVAADPVAWLEDAVKQAKASVPTPNPTRTPPPTASRQAAVAPPPHERIDLDAKASEMAAQGKSATQIIRALQKLTGESP